MRTFVIPVRGLTASGEDFEFSVERRWLEKLLGGCDLQAVQAGRIRVRASTSGQDVVVRGFVEVVLGAMCVRCLEPARLDLRGELERLYVPGDASSARSWGSGAKGRRAASSEESDTEGDVGDDVDAYDGDSVVLDEAVREQILLEVPMSPLCREDCPGLAEHRKTSARDGSSAVRASFVLPKKE